MLLGEKTIATCSFAQKSNLQQSQPEHSSCNYFLLQRKGSSDPLRWMLSRALKFLFTPKTLLCIHYVHNTGIQDNDEVFREDVSVSRSAIA